MDTTLDTIGSWWPGLDREVTREEGQMSCQSGGSLIPDYSAYSLTLEQSPGRMFSSDGLRVRE